jgi:hypothetical protein
MLNTEAYSLARRKARYGRRDWIVWRERSGAWQAAPRSPATLKAAMLARGTSGRWTLIAGSTAVPYAYGWRDGVTMIRNARFGW